VPLASAASHTLPGGQGLHTVWVKYRDDAGRESDAVSATVECTLERAGAVQVTAAGGTAQIVVDDMPTGLTTPATVTPLGRGFHRVSLLANGMKISPPLVVAQVDSGTTVTAAFVMVPARAPDAPAWREPEQGALLKVGGVLAWAPVSDPDSGAVFYDVSVYADSARTTNLWSAMGLSGLSLAVPPALPDSARCYGTVTAISGHYVPQVAPAAMMRFAVDRTAPSGQVMFPARGSVVPGIHPPKVRLTFADWGGLASALVLLSNDGGLTYPDTLYAGAYADSIAWLSPDLRSDRCRIRAVIRDRAGNVATVESDSLFSLYGDLAGTDPEVGPVRFELRVGPLPARHDVTVHFGIATEGPVRLEVFDVAGRTVRVLASGRYTPGAYTLPWDLHDGDGRRLGAGVYFVRLTAGGARRMSRVVLIE
jgi:hypothetical protein